MIHILGASDDPITTEIVVRAFERAFTRSQVRLIDNPGALPVRNAIVVAIKPDDGTAAALERLARADSKIILLGLLGADLAALAGVEPIAPPPPLATAAGCEPAPIHGESVSRAALVYAATGLGKASPLRRRHFARFDFAEEWNNLGYGRIGVGSDRWSIAQLARRCATPVADVILDGASQLGTAVTLHDLPQGAVMWFARPVGPVDGQDWAVVERFVSAHRAGELPCRPYLRGLPHGVDAAVTMRLDCDEDIASARPLFELYRSRGYPLSLAIKTEQPDRSKHLAADLTLLRDLRDAGGSILSHSATHAPRWGGSHESAVHEARASKAWLERHIAGANIRYAVSPFHQNPTYVPGALAEAGYDGFVSGSIANDPEYLMARAGVTPFGPRTIVSHSQSCMLHGDCMLATGDPLRVFKQAFMLARDSAEIFGYLDHPFSVRYAYGWPSEAQRIEMHSAYLDFVETTVDRSKLLFVTEDTCLDFIKAKAAIEIDYDVAHDTYTLSGCEAAGLPLSVGFRGEIVEARQVWKQHA